jgi:site-specific recombinase XerD
MAKITRRVVTSLQPDPTGKDIFRWDSGDGAIKGFGLRMKPSGSASYLAQYRNAEGRTRRLVLGAVSVLAPEQARKMAVDVLRDVSKGMDPSADRHAVRGSIRVSELCDLYLADAEHRIKPSTYKADVGRIRVHIKPLVGQLSVRGLTTVDVERFKADILNGKMAAPRKGRGGVVTGGPQAARRCVGLLGTILEHGRRLKIISDNPVRGVRKPPDRKSTRFLSMEEITRLGATMNSSTENPVALAAIRLLLLTGMRREEVLALPKAWVDCGSHCVRLEDSKGGFSIRPLGSAAVEVIEGMMIFDSPWLFPSERNDGHYVGLPRVLQRLCAKAELQRVTIHSLRHSFASVAEVMGFTQLTVAALLGHAAPGMTSRYIHHVDAALVVAADAVSTRIAEAMNEHSPNKNMA